MLNRLNGLANSWPGSFGFGYDALSRRTSLTRPNGVNTSYSYVVSDETGIVGLFREALHCVLAYNNHRCQGFSRFA
jgi:hypothetical protein